MKPKIPAHIYAIQNEENKEKKDLISDKNFKNIPHWKKTNLNEEEEEIVDILKTIMDPELGINIYELGLIYEIKSGEKIGIKMTFTTPFCPFASNILNQIEENLNSFLEKEVEVEIVFKPKWDTSFITENARLEAGIY